MNNELILNNYLLLLKSTVEVYIHGTLESSNVEIRDILKTGLDRILLSQEKTYDLMTQYGYYNVKNVKSSPIKETIKKITSKE